MLVDSRQEAVCALLKQSIFELCKASFAYEGNDVEIDGLLCISTKRSTGVENVIVKIHEQLWTAAKPRAANGSTPKPSPWSATSHNARVAVDRLTTSPVQPPSARGVPQRFESKRKSNTSLVSLLSDNGNIPKIAKAWSLSPDNKAQSNDTGKTAEMQPVENADPQMNDQTTTPKEHHEPEDTASDDKNSDVSPSSSGQSSKEITKHMSPTMPMSKPKPKKFSLDQVVSNLSENARLAQSSTNDQEKSTDVETVEVIHITPDTMENLSAQQNAFESNSVAKETQPAGESVGKSSAENFGVINIEPCAVYICDYCKQCFEDKNEYLAHKLACAGAKNVKNLCLLCNREFPDFNSLSLHSRIHIVSGGDRRESIWKGKPLTCGLCRCVLRSKRCLQEHMAEHSPGVTLSPYSCVTCDFVFPEFESFKTHRLNVHQNASNCRCENCDLFFTFKEFKSHEYECINGKRAHLAVVEAHNQVAMQRAESEASSNQISPHDNQVKPEPQSAFYDPDQSLDSSDVMVTDDKLYIDDAELENSSPVTVLNPVRNVTIIDDIPCQGPYRCQSCFTVFQEFNEYEVHNHEMHSRFVCSFCAQSFASRRNLHRHARRHTGVKPYQCPVCENTYTRDDDLKKHMQRVHNIRPASKTRSFKRTPTPPPLHDIAINSGPGNTPTPPPEDMELN